MTEPIAGNQYFSQVINQAEQIPFMNVGRSIIPTINTSLIKSNFIWTSNSPTLLGKKLYSITGNSSSSFNGLGASNAQFLNINPNQPSSIENDGSVLILPRGAIIVGAYAIDSAYVGGTIDIGMVKVNGTIPIAHIDDIFGGLSQATVNVGGLVAAIPEITGASAIGNSGDTQPSTLTVSNTDDTGITVTVSSVVTSSNGLVVTVYYLL